MPYGKRYTKKVTKSRARNNRKRKAYPRIPLGIESTKLVKLRYADNFTLNPTTGVIGVHTFCANGLYDPNITGTGHQPMYFDTYSAIYDQYVVLGSKITIHAAPSTAAAGTAVYFGCLLEDDNSSLATKTTNYMMEQKNNRYKTVNSVNYSNLGTSTLVKKFSAKKYYGVKDVKDNYDDIGSRVTSNPNDAAFFRVWCGPASTTIDPAQYQFNITIDYIVLFSELKEQDQS